MEQRRKKFIAEWWLIVGFYMVLSAWTLISAPLIINNASNMDTLLFGMIVFFISFTWYWSLGLVYGIEIEDNQTILLNRVRGKTRYRLDEMRRVEAPPSRIELGFLRLRFAKHTHYMFFNNSDELREILTNLKGRNPSIQFVKFSSGYFKDSYF